ncbi:hypothetical protein Tco_0145078 [Tanacetum coccineum]
MTTLQFADTFNLVMFLTKSTESEGFEQIVDFLNANSIKYALTVNPTIYTSCIEQFWSAVKAKMVNGEVQLQALVDGKKIVVSSDEAVTEEPTKVEADYQLAQRLQAKSKKNCLMQKRLHYLYNLKENNTTLCNKRAEEKRKQTTNKSQQRSFQFIWIQNYEESSKKAEAETAQENDGDDVTIEATPLSTKSPTISDKAKHTISKLLVEKMYPLTKHTLHQMFNDVKLQVDYECEMAFELLVLVKKQLKEGYVPHKVFGSILLVIDEAFNEET